MGKTNTGEVISGIYKITNNINGKFYIGQSIDVNHRFYEHKINLGKTHNSAIDTAIQKYGISNFSFEILEICDKEDLFDKEVYWAENIFEGKCYAPLGYNIAQTGIGSPKLGNVISCYDLNGNIIKTYLNSSRASRELNVTSVAIRNSIERNGICCGMQWRYGEEKQIKEYIQPKYGETICCYDENNTLVLTFPNEVEASKYFGITPSAISSFVNHKSGYVKCSGYYLAKNNEAPVIRDAIQTKNESRQVKCFQYNKDTRKLVGEYNSILEALKAIGKKDSKSIRNALIGKQNFAYGSIWSCEKFETIPENYREINKKKKEK